MSRKTLISLKGPLTKRQALAAIKQLRDHVNDSTAMWTNAVCYHLDQASDRIEFPEPIKRRSSSLSMNERAVARYEAERAARGAAERQRLAKESKS